VLLFIFIFYALPSSHQNVSIKSIFGSWIAVHVLNQDLNLIPIDELLFLVYTTVAAEKAAEELAQKAIKLGYGSAEVKLKGVGNNKQYVVQSLGSSGLKLTKLMDVTPIPYNGCRRPKKRRI
jgi:hypothetical protein